MFLRNSENINYLVRSGLLRIVRSMTILVNMDKVTNNAKVYCMRVGWSKGVLGILRINTRPDKWILDY